ncbi:hypothetical protein B2J93_4002 [Marssonina coronariae]|uniref:NmrA-like domain-containing protein n=1 Tax=Diplocarpon coronariae TaxID=2795749 RepID=A0A218ZAV8_9HELO|nr:hypothetical protein B2J93_4002 [Marssonina coronariae]
MAAKRVLVVFGATGLQGGSVVKAVLGDAKIKERWTIRGVIRRLLRSLWRLAQADEVVIEDAGVQHLIWRILMNVTQLSKGVLTQVLHSDSKAHIERYIRDTGLPATYFMPGFHMSNVPGSNFRQAPPNNDWAFALPVPSSSPIPLLSTADDVGKFVMGILLNREKVLGKQIYGATDYQTPDQIAQPFKEQFPEAGKTAKSVELLHQVFKEILGSKGMPA